VDSQDGRSLRIW